MSLTWLVLAAVVTVGGLVGCKDKIADGAADGARIYTDACSSCHGAVGVPSPAMIMQYGVADLTTDEFKARATTAYIRERVSNGVGNKGMPAFASVLSDAQLDAIAAFVQTLGH